MDSLTDVAVFVQVVQSGSFTAAAERLSLSKSVVSKYITRLENRLGARLLNRTTRKLSLTEVGQTFYEKSQLGLQEIAEAELEVTRLQEQPRGRLRLNTPMSFGILHVAPALAAFSKEFPDITVEMNLDDRKVDVIEEGFDVSLRISELPDSSLIARRLCRCRHVIVAAPSYLKRHGNPDSPHDLSNHPAVTYRYQMSAQEWHFLSADNTPINVTIKQAMQVNNSLAIRQAILDGVGVARMPSFVVGEDIKSGRLLQLLPEFKCPEPSIYLIYPQRQHLSPKVRAFVQFMAARIPDPPPWD